MGRLHVTLARRTHDVVEECSQLQDFETLLAEIAIAADISVIESKDVAEFVSERAW